MCARFTALLVEYTEVVVADTNAPVISALSPTNGATGALVDADLTITFDEPVQKGSGNIVIKEIGGNTFETIDVTTANVTVNGSVVTINPTSDLGYGTNYYVEIASGAITDAALTPNPFAGISGSATWSFTSGKIPTVISIDFDSDDVVQSGDLPNALGMTLPGQGGPWYKLPVGDSPSSPTITTPGGTFTFNTTGASYRRYRPGSVLREDFFWLTEGYGPCTWTLTGLTPGATYDIICYGRYDAAYGGYRGADMSIVGYNGGLPVTQEHGDSEGDWDFPGVVADGTGKIQGTICMEW